MTETLLSTEACLTALESQMDAFEAIARTADPALPVAISRKWGLAGLVNHLGRVHLWAADTLATGSRGNSFPGVPDGADLAQWYRGCADRLLTELRAADPNDPCWNFSVVPRVKAFWFRRQLHETTIHRYDADAACGAITTIPAEIAGDGIDEVLRTMMPVGHRWEGKPAPELTGPIVVRAGDTGQRWVIEPTGGPVPAADGPRVDPVAEPVATVDGDAATLYLWLWQRAPFGSVRISGDVNPVRQLLESQITP